jgi:hypothetical protein
MSRGLGREQRAILAAAASAPDRCWQRAALQQAAWGKLDPKTAALTISLTGRPTKNVQPWRRAPTTGAPLANEEGNFTRALASLERRGLLERHCHPDFGRRPRWTVTAAGLVQARTRC